MSLQVMERIALHPSPLRPVELRDSHLKFVVDNMPDAKIGTSRIHGNGLHAARALPAGKILGWLDGQLVDWATYEKVRVASMCGEGGDDLFMEWNAISTDTLLVRPFRTKYSFINHSREPNLVLRHDPLRVVVAHELVADEELTLDYRREPLRPDYLRKATYL